MHRASLLRVAPIFLAAAFASGCNNDTATDTEGNEVGDCEAKLAKGQLVIVEIKVARADLLGDTKWPDYLDYCDRFYWGLAPHLDRNCMEDPAFLPERCGLIVADGYDAEVLRPAATVPLAAARRKAETERLARAALRRHHGFIDPGLAGLV